ncbi:D-cysteine desulfhydrase [Staphylococcus saprophyticus]
MAEYEGNLFLDAMLGAHIHIIEPTSSREDAMDKLYKTFEGQGKTPFLIPVGASDWIGTHGYVNAYNEIIKQQDELKVHFDSINVAVGSGGTYAGLWYGQMINCETTQIIGYAVDQSAHTFKNKVIEIIKQLDETIQSYETITINDAYIGLGYGKATDEELQFYIDIAQKEGIILDPTYTGKAFRGLVHEIKSGAYDNQDNILFIHTGGLQGYTQETRLRLQTMLHKIDLSLLK